MAVNPIRHKDWCLTLNNPLDFELKSLEDVMSGLCPDITYFVFGFEVGKSGTPHVQGYLEYRNPCTIARLKKYGWGYRSHLEGRRGTQEQARNYCKKDGNWCEYGDPRDMPGQGTRSDLKKIGSEILAGANLEEIAKEYPAEYIRYNRGFRELSNLNKPGSWRDVEVIVYWGDSGSGKTREAMNDAPYKLNQNSNGTLWFDGYAGEETLLLDDFYGWIRYGELLTLLDGYPYRCQIKGSSTWARWKKVVITSNKHPEEWYVSIDKTALYRRITSIEHFKN